MKKFLSSDVFLNTLLLLMLGFIIIYIIICIYYPIFLLCLLPFWVTGLIKKRRHRLKERSFMEEIEHCSINGILYKTDKYEISYNILTDDFSIKDKETGRYTRRIYLDEIENYINEYYLIRQLREDKIDQLLND